MVAPQMTDSENQAIKMYIILPMILSAFERDSKVLETPGLLKTPSLYTEAIHAAMDRVTLDLKEVRQVMRRSGTKVYNEERRREGVSAEYICRGYTGSVTLLWNYLAAESIRLMRTYMGLNYDTNKK